MRTPGKRGRQFFADALEKLLVMPLDTKEDVAAWHAASKQLHQTIHLHYPDVEYEGAAYHFLSWVGAETRQRDPGFPQWQEAAVRTYIAKVRAEG
jgi:hypothetical protein